jgi:thiamine pyrophosphokinase
MKGSQMRIFVVAGSPEAEPPDGLAPGPGDRVIAADRGGHHARAWGWPVDLLIGDLDSLPGVEASAIVATGTPVITAPAAKDETDLELALAEAVRLRPDEIIICAALGGRADHMLANLLLLAKPEFAEVRTVIAQGNQLLQLWRGQLPLGHGDAAGTPKTLVIPGKPGDLLSLLPVGGDAAGISTQGLLYPLHDETLYMGQPRGVSNVFTAPKARLWLRTGMLMVIQTKGQVA